MLVDLRVHLASGTTVLVEVDGPFHFVADATAPVGWRTNGATRLKHARLQWQAEPFVTISCHEWSNVKQHVDRRRQFFESLWVRVSACKSPYVPATAANRADSPFAVPQKQVVPVFDMFSFQSAPGHPPTL
jgi:hypothetical protein